MKLHVNLGKDSYDIKIEKNLLTDICPHISALYSGRKLCIISDDNVFSLYGDQISDSLSSEFEVSHLILPHGEATKAFDSLKLIYKKLTEEKLTRTDIILALGGGVIGDLAGFAAASFLRGIDFIQVPTSLLAQVDSSVGGKVAVDLPQGKNLVGAFYQPKLVLIDPSVLSTLPTKYINDGMGEVIKYGCIKDEALFDILESHNDFSDLEDIITDIIFTCVDIKRRVVENDQFDRGERMLLNFGHTLAHAIEQFYDYKRESHGEAVAIGMYAITNFSEEKGLTSIGTAERIKSILIKYSLPYRCDISTDKLIEAISLDKKNLLDSLNVILLKDIGESYIYKTGTSFFTSTNITIL
ncbi:MAG: 3-dehydroquinate synthase [Suipraeoptans sp.]